MDQIPGSVPAVELQSISKLYGAVVANEGINLRVRSGEIHAIVGENGAGKSTLMKILAGVTRPDAGTILVHGREQHFRSPADAIRAGIGMVFQHFRLVQAFTVAENVLLGAEDGMASDRRSMATVVGALADRYNIDINPEATVGTLGVGEQQRVEILKVLYRDARVIILDEPTAVLTPGEVESFFQNIRSLREDGATVILITHKLAEVMELCDRVTVMRQGKVVAEKSVAETTMEELAALMVGGAEASDETRCEVGAEPDDSGRDGAADDPEVTLEVRGLVPFSKRWQNVGRPVSFRVSSGRIVGIAGVEGNGQSELVEALMGLRKVSAGEVWFQGENISSWSVKARRKAGIAYIPEDRQKQGLVLDFTLGENLRLGRHFKETRLAGGNSRSALAELLQTYDVRPAEPDRHARELSGGNQQKLVMARELSRGAPLLIASQPTRGVDLGSARAIHEHMKAQRSAGAAVLLVSSDLDEILNLSDTIMVLYNGAIVFKSVNVGLDERLLGWYMAGGDTDRAVKSPE